MKLTRARKWLPTIALAAIPIACSQGPKTHNHSHTKVMSPFEMNCTMAPAERSAQITEQYSQHFRGDNQDQQTAAQVLGKVPDEHLEWSFTTNNMPLTLNPGFGGGGVTELSYFQRPGGGRPTRMEVRTKIDALPENLMHEMGHATDTWLERQHEGYFQDLENTYRQAMAAPESRQMWDYSRSTKDEYFAQGYSAFYCSPATYQMLQEKFPLTFDFLSRYLPPPEEF